MMARATLHRNRYTSLRARFLLLQWFALTYRGFTLPTAVADAGERFELVINLKTVNALSLPIADRWQPACVRRERVSSARRLPANGVPSAMP